MKLLDNRSNIRLSDVYLFLFIAKELYKLFLMSQIQDIIIFKHD